MVTELPSGLVVDLSPDLLLRFCREEWAYYDGVPDRDPARILPEDVTVTVAMNSFVDTAEKVRTVHRGMVKACDWTLRDIPVDADIRTFDLDGVIALELFTAACRIKGVLLPVATKVLHRKRPGWIPMIDNVVLVAYLDALGRGGMKARTQEGAKAAGVGVFVMNAFRKDLEAVADEVDQVAQALKEAGTPMTPVRILEVAVWMAIEPKGYYR
jgi:hypothetical protein